MNSVHRAHEFLLATACPCDLPVSPSIYLSFIFELPVSQSHDTFIIDTDKCHLPLHFVDGFNIEDTRHKCFLRDLCL